MTWVWNVEWIYNLLTVAIFVALWAALTGSLWVRSKGRRRDRLVLGLMGVFAYLTVAFSVSFFGPTERGGLNLFNPDLWARSALRTGGVIFALVALVALKTAPPLWEPRTIADLRNELARLRMELDRQREGQT